MRTLAPLFVRAQAGATAVEFGLIAPMLLGTLLFLMSAGYSVLMGEALDSATQKAARQVRTGQVQSAALTQDQFRTQIVCGALPSLFNCNDVIVNLQAVSSTGPNHPNEYFAFVNSSQTDLIVPPLSNAQTNYCPNLQKTYVYLQVLYPSNFFVSLFSTSVAAVTYNGQKRYLLMATATFLNEPFGTAGASC